MKCELVPILMSSLGVFCAELIPFVPGDGWCNLEGGVSRETRPSSSSLSESEMTSGGLGTQTPAALPCWTKPLGPGGKEMLPIHHFVFKYTFMYKLSLL